MLWVDFHHAVLAQDALMYQMKEPAFLGALPLNVFDIAESVIGLAYIYAFVRFVLSTFSVWKFASSNSASSLMAVMMEAVSMKKPSSGDAGRNFRRYLIFSIMLVLVLVALRNLKPATVI